MSANLFIPDIERVEAIQAAVKQAKKLFLLVPKVIPVQRTRLDSLDDDWDIIAPSLLAAAANCLVSTMSLPRSSEPRRDQDATVLLRRIYEYALDFAWIAIDPPKNIRRWVADAYKHQLDLDTRLRECGVFQLSPEERERYNQYRASVPVGLPNVLQRAEAADTYWSKKIEVHGTFPKISGDKQHSIRSVQDGYWSFRTGYVFIYRGGSAMAHPTAISLYHYILGPQVGYTPLEEMDRFGYTLCPIVFAVMLLVSQQVLGFPDANKIYAALGSRR